MKHHTYNEFIKQDYIIGLTDTSTDDVKLNIEKLVSHFNTKQLRNKSKIIRNLIRYKVIGDWIEKLSLAENEKVGSIQRFVTLYGEETGKMLFDASNAKRKTKIKQTHFSSVSQFFEQKPFKDLKPEEHELEYITAQLDNVIKVFDKKYILNNKKEVIQTMLKYKVDGDWVNRLNEGDKFKKDGLSEEACIVKYGEIIGRKIHNERIQKNNSHRRKL